MKKFIFIAVIFILGCSKGESPQPQPQPPPQPSLYMAFSKTSIQFAGAGGENTLEVESTYPWNAQLLEPGSSSWLTFTPAGGGSGKTTIRVTASPNNASTNRTATIGFQVNNQTASVTISQNTFGPASYYADGEVIKLQSATAATGRGIELVVMGDGYTIADMAKGGSGKYETQMRAAVEHFFSTYPYTVHRNRFNVWMVAAVSNEQGISVANPARRVDNKFKSVWEGGESTGVDCDGSIVDRYALPVASLSGKSLSELTVILPINADINAGTAEMRPDGFSFAMCPVGPAFKNVVVHESGGHGFAKLGDEYAYNETTVPADRMAYIRSVKTSYGFYANLDFSADIARTSWSAFAGIPKYSMVGTFEGGSSYLYGIWRPEANSSMSNGILYFNAPSRWAQVKRMYELEGTPYTFEQFLADDVVPPVPAPTRDAELSGYFTKSAPPIVAMPRGGIDK